MLAGYDVVRAARVDLDGRSLFIDGSGHLRALEHSWLGNNIGVSTLAITLDGKVLIVDQARRNVGSPGELAPSGSGSMEWKDLVGTKSNDYRAVVVTTAERELLEECNLTRQQLPGSHVTEYWRWLDRGAKPEFSVVTLLGVRSDEIYYEQIRRSEQNYVGGVTAARLDDHLLKSLGDDPMLALPVEVRRSASLPLRVAVVALADAIEDHSWAAGAQIHAHLTSAGLEGDTGSPL